MEPPITNEENENASTQFITVQKQAVLHKTHIWYSNPLDFLIIIP